MTYKVIPGPKAVHGSSSDAANAFQEIINAEAVDGWKYHSMETITSVTIKAGCTGQSQSKDLYMLIFYKED